MFFGKEGAGRNLPFGVIVDNLGLNGLLVLENQRERVFFVTADRSTPEQVRPFHLTTGVEGGQSSRPVLLRVRKPRLEAAAVPAPALAGRVARLKSTGTTTPHQDRSAFAFCVERAIAMRWLRFSIAGLMGIIVLVAIATAALRYASETVAAAVSLMTYLVLALAVVGAVCRRGAGRAWWVGFGVARVDVSGPAFPHDARLAAPGVSGRPQAGCSSDEYTGRGRRALR